MGVTTDVVHEISCISSDASSVSRVGFFGVMGEK